MKPISIANLEAGTGAMAGVVSRVFKKQPAVAALAGSLPHEFVLFLRVLVATVLLSLCDALIRWPLQGASSAFSAIFLIYPLFDIECYWFRFTGLHTPAFFFAPGQLWTYPAPCAFVYRFIYKLSTLETLDAVYLCLGVFTLGVAASLFGQYLEKAGLASGRALAFVLAVSFLSWPIYFSFERGNIESFLWLVLAFGLASFVRGRTHLAAVTIGFIAAFKIYPLLFLALFLPRRRFREVGEALLVTGLTTLAGLRFEEPSFHKAVSGTRHGVQAFLAIYSGVYNPSSSGYDHSAWGLIKPSMATHPHLIQQAVSKYTLVAGALAVAFYFVSVWKTPRFNQLLAVCTLMVLLPATSFDYTLQAMYIPFAWLCLLIVRARRTGGTVAGASAYMVAFGLLFGPLVFVRGHTYTLNGQLKALVLLGLLYLAVRYPVPESESTAEGSTLENVPGLSTTST